MMLRRIVLHYLLLSAVPAVAQEAPAYVGSENCIDCHTDEARAWSGSHHALAWTWPSTETVVADFDGTTFSLGKMTARFSISEAGRYHVDVTETDGTTTGYDVHSVVGIEPLQQYLLETEPGRLQSFDVVWDTVNDRWFHLYPDQDLPPDDGLHWTGPYKTWNARCAECHATGFEKNYDAENRRYASTQSEIGVGCEACHGPGSTHVAWAESLETARAAPTPDNYGFSMDFSDAEATVQQCATCHSRREAYLDGNPQPGTPFHDSYNLSLLRPGLYHPDGQILDEVYVYGSFLQSKMYAAGVTCTKCHDPHGAGLVSEGNAVCTQCHSPAGNPDFPRLRLADYDTPDHHHHITDTAGAECKSCHMGERVYMGNDWRADHYFRVPRPDLTRATGAPDACTGCHDDRSPDWAAGQIANWFPDPTHRGSNYGPVLANGRENPSEASLDLVGVALDDGNPNIVRATALWLLEQAASPQVAGQVAPLLEDPDPLVHAAAIGVQRFAEPQDRLSRLLTPLTDPVRSVRIAVARALFDLPFASLPEKIREDLRAALSDWRGSLTNRLDFPETHLQIAGVSLTLRNFDAAANAFHEAVRLDPQRTEAWIMIARIRNAMGAAPEVVEEIIDDALAVNPGDVALLSMKAEIQSRNSTMDLLPPTSD
ncbi:multiheme c-type cytochrome [Pseudoruegeria sp. HB172150]|uniref:multiheme c-type cytochrome n=1 Tax=Pseudoruegeria sp. HB172150 TaxID=2721164 RepID=UPI0015557B06|nr:multiheme c-type cytochrome [Pseudoruegeria sp. HB172150]